MNEFIKDPILGKCTALDFYFPLFSKSSIGASDVIFVHPLRLTDDAIWWCASLQWHESSFEVCTMGTNPLPGSELHLHYLLVAAPQCKRLGWRVLVCHSLRLGVERPLWIQQINMDLHPTQPRDKSQASVYFHHLKGFELHWLKTSVTQSTFILEHLGTCSVFKACVVAQVDVGNMCLDVC